MKWSSPAAPRPARPILGLHEELGVTYLNALSAFFGFLPIDAAGALARLAWAATCVRWWSARFSRGRARRP